MPLATERFRLLIVEDEEDVRDMLASSLQAYFTIETAGSIAEAAIQLDKTSIQIILLDLMLPNGQGLSVVRYFQEHFGEVPMVVISGYNFRMEDVIHAGAHAFVRKPVRIMDSLVETLIQTIARHHVRGRMIPIEESINALEKTIVASSIKVEKAAKKLQDGGANLVPKELLKEQQKEKR